MWEMEENNNDDSWSLLAVVKECSRKTRTSDEPGSGFIVGVDNPMSDYNSHYGTTGYSSFDELVNLYKPFVGSFPNIETGCGSGVVAVEPRQNPPEQHQLQAVPEAGGGAAAFHPQQVQHDDYPLALQPRGSQNRRPFGNYCPVGIHKKKRFEERRVFVMRIDELSDDKWAWRKYGQKPIKGSPYPRNYYRCSSSKGCGARKLVERSPSDPNAYLVTYTGHHYHARPPPRANSSASRATRAPGDATSSPEGESSDSPTDDNPIPTPMPDDQNGSGLGSGSGEPVVNADENEEAEEKEDYNVELIPNSMADPELLMGMERLKMTMEISGERKTMNTRTGLVGNGCEYHREMMMMSNPNVNLGW